MWFKIRFESVLIQLESLHLYNTSSSFIWELNLQIVPPTWCIIEKVVMFALSMDPNNTSQEIIGSKALCVVNASQWSSYSVNQQVNTLGFVLHILFRALVFVQLFAVIILFFFSSLNARCNHISASRLEQNCFCYILVLMSLKLVKPEGQSHIL